MNKLDEELVEKIQKDIEKNKMLEDLYESYKVGELLRFTEHNIVDKIRDNPFISEQFRLLFLKESQNFKRIEILYDELVGKKYDFFKYESEKSLSKTEIEKYYLPKNPEILKMKDLLYKQLLRTEFFESVWKALERQAWLMKMYQKETNLI